jgi:glutamine synthetase
VSVFLGDELNAIIQSIIDGTNYEQEDSGMLRIGVDTMPPVPKDTTDRNRTSPLAFSGNKFEFRMLGSSQSIADTNVALNTIMAEELGKFADELERADDFESALQNLVCRTFTEHQRIIFGGNGYSEEWAEEAARRGLSNYPSTAQCLPTFISQKNIDLVTSHGIYTEDEFRARYEIYLDAYRKIINIEAKTCLDMSLHQILPAAVHYTKDLCQGILSKKELQIPCQAEDAIARKLSNATDKLYLCCEKLREDLAHIPETKEDVVNYYHDTIVTDMQNIREQADILESLTDKSYWPYPTYSDLLFY